MSQYGQSVDVVYAYSERRPSMPGMPFLPIGIVIGIAIGVVIAAGTVIFAVKTLATGIQISLHVVWWGVTVALAILVFPVRLAVALIHRVTRRRPRVNGYSNEPKDTRE
jgi:hypothetical protein